MYIEVKTVLGYLSSIFTSATLQRVHELFSEECINDERYRIEWITDFKSRLFLDSQLRNRELVTITRDRCFSDRNTNFVNPYRVCGHFGPELYVENSRGFGLSYSIKHEKNQLIFKIRIGKDLYSVLDQHEVVLFIVNNKINDNLDSLVRYYISFTKVSGHVVIQEIEGMSYDIQSNGIIIKLPLELLPIEVGENGSRKIGYGLGIKHEILSSIYHWLTLNPYEKEFWNKPPIMELV